MIQNEPAPLKKETGFFNNSLLTATAFAFFGSTKFGFNILVQWFYDSTYVGNYNLVISSAMIAGLVITSIFNVAVSKFASEARGKNDNEEFLFVVGFYFRMLAASAVVVSLVFYFLAETIARHVSGDPSLFKWAPSIVFLFCFYNFFKRFYYVMDMVFLYTVIEVIAVILFFASLVICLLKKQDHLLLLPTVLHMAFFATASFILFFKHLRSNTWRTRFKQYIGKVKALFYYSLIAGTGTAITTASMHMFAVILGYAADARSVGHYSLLRSTVEPANYLYRILTTVNFPRIAFLYGQGNIEKLKGFVRKGSRQLALLTASAFIPAAFLSPYISRFIFKTGVPEGAVLLFSLMLLALFIRTAVVFHLSFLSATRYPHIPNLISPLAMILIMPFIPMVFTHFGLAGLGWLILLAEIVRTVSIYILGEKKLSTISLP